MNPDVLVQLGKCRNCWIRCHDWSSNSSIFTYVCEFI